MINIIYSWDRNPIELFRYAVVRMYRPEWIKKSIIQLKNNYINYNNTKLFSCVNIETVSACNNNCSFCPVSSQNNTRKKVCMTEELFNKILVNLKKLNYKGRICPYINNELLLDKEIFNRIKLLKSIGDVSITVETNGKLLDIDRLYRLYECGVEQVYINDYADTLVNYFTYNCNIKNILKDINKIDIKKDVRLVIAHRLKKQILSDRSGKVKGINMSITDIERFCDFPFYQLNINPEGIIFICCRDSYYGGNIGNIADSSLENIWFGTKYDKIRKEFLANNRLLEVCKNCHSNGSITI